MVLLTAAAGIRLTNLDSSGVPVLEQIDAILRRAIKNGGQVEPIDAVELRVLCCPLAASESMSFSGWVSARSENVRNGRFQKLTAAANALA